MAPALPRGWQHWAEGQPRGLTPWRGTLLFCAPPAFSLAPEPSPALPPALPTLAISPRLKSPPVLLCCFSPYPITMSHHLWVLSTPCSWCPVVSQWGGVWDRWQHIVSCPQPCLCPLLTPHSTHRPSRRHHWDLCRRTHLCTHPWH